MKSWFAKYPLRLLIATFLLLSGMTAFATFNATVTATKKAGATVAEWSAFHQVESAIVVVFPVQPTSKSLTTSAVSWTWANSDCAGYPLAYIEEEMRFMVTTFNTTPGYPATFALNWTGGDCNSGTVVPIPGNFLVVGTPEAAFQLTWDYPHTSGYTFDIYKNDGSAGYHTEFSVATRIRTGLTVRQFTDTAVARGEYYAYWIVAVRTSGGQRSVQTRAYVVELSPCADPTAGNHAVALSLNAYVKASNTGGGDEFGYAVAMDGNIAVVGAPNEDSNARGVNGPQNNEGDSNSGAAYVFYLGTDGIWRQEAYLKPSNVYSGGSGVNDPRIRFGTSVAVSGQTIAIGGPGDITASGSVYVFARAANGIWSQQARLRASDAASLAEFGTSVAIDGNTLVAGAPYRVSDVTAVERVGGAYVFVRNGTAWTQEAFIIGANTALAMPPASGTGGHNGGADRFGWSVAVSGDAAVVGAPYEDTMTAGVHPGSYATVQPGEFGTFNTGAAYVFRRSGNVWTREAFIKASNPGMTDLFGETVAISGNIIAVGARGEDSGDTAINGNGSLNDSENTGAAYMFIKDSAAAAWRQEAYLKPPVNNNAFGVGSQFGASVCLKGTRLLVSAPTIRDKDCVLAGAAFLYDRTGTSWVRQSAFATTPLEEMDMFGGYSTGGLAFSGVHFLAGGKGEDGGGMGVGQDPMNNGSTDAGAAWFFQVTAPLAPEIVVEQPAGTNLTDGAATVNWGSVNTGSSATRDFTVRNTGTASLTGVAVNFTGGNTADFSVVTAPATTVAAGGSATFSIRFTPGATGTRTTTLRVASNDANENPFDITLSGTGGGGLPEVVVEYPVGTNLTDGGSMNFGSAVTVGSTGTAVFTVRNSGGVSLTGLAVTITGTNAADYSVLDQPPTGLVAGFGSTFSILFTPTAAGTRNAVVRLASNDADENPFDINVSGTGGVAAPEIAVEQPAGTNLTDGAATVNWGSVNTGSSATRDFTVRNTGTASLTGVGVSFTGGNTADFSVVTAPATTVAAGGSATFSIRFTPGATGARSTTLRVASNDANENPFDITLSGTGGGLPEVAVEHPLGTNLTDGGSVSFGSDYPVGMSTGTVGFTVRNTGGASLTGLGLTIVGTHAADFSVVIPPPAALVAGGSTTFAILFTPTVVGTRSAIVRFSSNDADENPFDINVSGTVVATSPEIAVEQPVGTNLTDGTATVNWGAVNMGASATRDFTVRNTGTAPLTGVAVSFSGGNTGDFAVTAAPAANVGSGGTATFTVRFTPAATGARTTTLRVVSNDANENPFDITLTGSGAAVPEVAVEYPVGTNLTDDGSMNFGSAVTIGSNIVAIFTVRNTGGASLTGLGVTIAGTNAADFAVTAQPAASIAASGSTTFTVRFTPAAAGARSAILRLASNDADENPFDINVTCTGTAPAPEVAVEQPAGTGLTSGTGTVSFASTTPGSNSSLTFTVRNTGPGTLTGLAASFSGVHAGDFSIPTAPATSVASGGNVTFTVRFAPLANGDRSAVLSLASNDSDENPFSIPLTGYAQVTLASAVEGESFVFQTGGNVPWFSQLTVTHVGGDAVRSGAISHGQNTWLQTSVTGPGTLSFWWRVSSENPWDGLEFLLDGTPHSRITGEVAWAQRTVNITGAGTHTLRWLFAKDDSVTTGSDAAWMDGFDWIPQTSFNTWAAAAGLTGTNAQPLSAPRGDGVANLLKYAFNLNPAAADRRILTPATGTAGLPLISITGPASARILRVEFLRRKGSGLTYTPRKTTSVTAGPWQPLTDTPTVTNIDATWERVVYEESVTGARWFARVEVALP